MAAGISREMPATLDAEADVVIVGAGAIGLEMAHAFVRLGSRVTLVDLADRVLPSAAASASAIAGWAARPR